jgi:hypothetical protein
MHRMSFAQLTFCDHKSRLIGESETPGALDIANAAIPDDEDGLKDSNPPTVNKRCGSDDTHEINWQIVETVKELKDPVEEPEGPCNSFNSGSQ